MNRPTVSAAHPPTEAATFVWAAGETASPIVFLHGFSGAAASFTPVVEALAPPHDRILAAVPLLGHCGHPAPTRWLAASTDPFAAEVNRIAAALRALSHRRVHLVGYSMGARVALGVLVDHPHLVARATLIGVHPGLDAEARRERALADRRWIDRLEREGIADFVAAWEQLPMWAGQAALPAAVREAQRATRLRHAPAGLAVALAALGLGSMPDYRLALPRIAAPVQLVVGERDAKFRAIAADMYAALPHARLAIVSGAGHNPVLEAPATVAALIHEHDIHEHDAAGLRAPAARPRP